MGYERDPLARSLETRVDRQDNADGRLFLVLQDTVLYPEGGGQPSDHGLIGGASIDLVQRVEGEVRHFVAGPPNERGDDLPKSGDSVVVRVDWSRRFDHMQQHTAQHLLSAVAQDRFGWKTTAFHLGERRCDVELEVEQLDVGQISDLEDAVAEEIRASRAVRAYRVEPEEMERLEVRTRGLPAGHQGTVRLVEIDGIDINTCGGTHLSCTSEIEALSLLGTEPMRGGTRLYFVAGRRLRGRLREHEERLGTLRDLLDVGDDEIVEATEARAQKLTEATRAQKRWLESWCGAIGAQLALDDDTFVELHDERCDLKALQLIARELGETQFALLTGGTEPDTCFLVRGAKGTDVAELGGAVAELFGGRGGGRGPMFQGRCASLARRSEAVEKVARQAEPNGQ